MVTTSRRGDFERLWGALGVSAVGDGIRLAALPLLLYSLTSDAVAISLVTAATYLPWALGPVVGTVVDRHDRRRLLLGAQVLRGAVVLGLAAAATTGTIGPGVVYAVAFLLGLGEVVVDTAMQAAIPHLAGQRSLDEANGRLQATETLANRVVGPTVGALLFAVAAAVPFAVDGATFLVATLLVLTIRTPMQEPRTDGTSFRQDVVAGLRHLRDDPVLRPLAVLLFLANVAVASYTAVFVIMALDVLRIGEAGYGVVLSVAAVGGVIGGLATPWLVARLGRRRLPAVMATVASVALLLIWLRPTLVVLVPAIVVANAAGAAFSVFAASLRQLLTPSALLGRVSSGFRAITITGGPVGAVLGGVVAAGAGVPASFGFAGATFAVVAIGLLRVGRAIPAELDQVAGSAAVTGDLVGEPSVAPPR